MPGIETEKMEAVPFVRLGFAVLAQLRVITQSITERIENYNRGPASFQRLSEDLRLLAHNIDEVDKILKKFPVERLVDISSLFEKTLDQIHSKLQESDATVENELSTAFARNCVGFLRRAFRATALSKKMKAVKSQIKESSNQLQHISTVLASALNSKAILTKIDSLVATESGNEVFRRTNSAPTVSHTVNLDFETKDAQGEFATPEGSLMHKVLSSISSETITSAAGALNPAYGAVGMAGAGKTIALQGLARENKVRARFPDGIHFMSLGEGATVQRAIQEIAQAMTWSGATSGVLNVANSTSLGKAVTYACTWFQDKKCLFLIDDLWPTDECPTGYLDEFRQLVRESPESRVAISTRNVNIALGAGSVVDFAAREPQGAVSLAIFMRYATNSVTACRAPDANGELLPSVAKILTWCGGLPIALSVTGSAVALLVKNIGNLERACDICVKNYEEGATNLAAEKNPQGARLRDGILLSLKYLQVEFSNWKETQAVDMEHTISDLYTSLCVLTNQLWIPVSVLGRMWRVDESTALNIVNLFCGMSLATLSCRKAGEGVEEKAGLTLHDLHLDFCKQEGKKSEPLWHSELLSGYLASSSNLPSVHLHGLSSQQLVRLLPRPWWSEEVPEDGYIHFNLARHLALSRSGSELAALLLDARWLNMRAKFGGMLGLQADFAVLDNLFGSGDGGREEHIPSKTIWKKFHRMRQAVHRSARGRRMASRDIQKSARLIIKAIQLSWGSFSDGQRAFQFQMSGRLFRLRRKDIIVRAVMNSYEAHTPKPYIRPVSSFFPKLYSAQILEIPVGGWCGCVACSPCGRYVAAVGGHDIVIADPVTGDELKRLKGHNEDVTCISFTKTLNKLVSASEDKTIAVWEFEKSNAAVLVLEGHHDWVAAIDVSGDGDCIVSGSRDCTLRVWSGTTGLQTGEFEQPSAVDCVGLCPDVRKVAVGLENGTVKVLDILAGDILFEDSKAHAKSVTSVSFSPDGHLLATGSSDKTIRSWDTRTWEAKGPPAEGHTEWVTSVAFSPDSKQLVSGSLDNTVRLWYIEQAQSVGSSSDFSILTERNVFLSEWATSVTFTFDGKRIASGSSSGIARIWDAQFASEEEQQGFRHNAAVLGISISPNGLCAASASADGTVRLWNTQKGVQVGSPLQGHERTVACVSFSPDGQHLVSGSQDKTMRIWDREMCTQVGNQFETHSNWVSCVAYSSDGLRIVSGGADMTVRLWNVETREQIGGPLVGHKNWVNSVAETLDGLYVVSRDGEELETIIWNRESREIVWRSREKDGNGNNSITNIDAENIVRSCGQETPHLWSNSFPEYNAEIYCKGYSLYSNVGGENILLGNLPSEHFSWRYAGVKKVFAAGLSSGGVAVCRLIGESS